MISIITPSFNQGKFIERTIQSVLSQKISPLEYMIMDGGSQDETQEIVQRYSSQLYFISEPDRGQAHAVNKGLKMTTGEIIGWLNSDDIYYSDAIHTIKNYFDTHPEIDVVYGDANHIDQQDRVIESYPTQDWNKKGLETTCYLSQPAVFFRRRVIDQCGYLLESLYYCMDYEYWLRLALRGMQFAHIKKILAGSRLYPETKTRRAPLQVLDETLAMLHYRLGKVPTPWLIKHASLSIKTETTLRFPEWRFIFLVCLNTFSLEMRWNKIRGCIRCIFLLPFHFISVYRKKK